MRSRANFVAAITFVVGVTAFFGYAQRVRAEAQGGYPQSVLILTQDLSAGTVLTEQYLAQVEVPADYLDDRRVRLASQQDVLGAQLAFDLKAGQGLYWSDIKDHAAIRHLAQLIEAGKRAYQLDESANALGSLLHAGDHVDVLLERAGESEVVLQDVAVLAVAGRLREQNEEEGAEHSAGSGLTLSVTPSEATALFSAEGRGQLRVVLRNSSDRLTQSSLVSNQQTREPTSKNTTPLGQKGRIEHVR